MYNIKMQWSFKKKEHTELKGERDATRQCRNWTGGRGGEFNQNTLYAFTKFSNIKI